MVWLEYLYLGDQRSQSFQRAQEAVARQMAIQARVLRMEAHQCLEGAIGGAQMGGDDSNVLYDLMVLK